MSEEKKRCISFSVIPQRFNRCWTKSLDNINYFFCDLYSLVGLTYQAESCLKLWERLDWWCKSRLIKSWWLFKRRIGYITSNSYCMSVSEKGCGKSDKMVTFSTFLIENYNMSEIPLYPFLGNHFNILFLNGGGASQLYSKLKEFFDKIEKENKLSTSVYWDLHVLQSKVGCSCLVLIHSLLSGAF